MGPGRDLFELGGELQQQHLAAIAGHELHADGQTVRVPVSGRLIAGWPVPFCMAVNGT